MILISWLSWVKILRWIEEAFLPILLFLEIGFFWNLRVFGPGGLNNIISLILLIGSFYFYFKRKKETVIPLSFLAIFLGYIALFYLHFAFSLPLWLSEILVLFFSLILFFYLCFEENQKKDIYLFFVPLAISLLEVFFVLSFWPTNPLSKSFVLVSIFYLFWYTVIKKDIALDRIILVLFALLIVLITTRWPEL